MTSLRKSTVMLNHVIVVNLAVFWGKYHAVCLLGTWNFRGRLPSPLL